MSTHRSHSAHAAASFFMPLRKFLALGVLTLGAFSMAPDAQASGTQHALTCVGTETGETVYFQYRWGLSGEWRRSEATPGHWQVITYRYRYAGENSAPQLELRFDDDLSSGVNMVRQKLKSYAARTRNCEAEGYTYNFVDRAGELFLHSDESRGGGSSL